MDKANPSKILILPERKTALKKTLVNAFFYALGAVFLVLALLACFFPKFFLFLVFRYYSKFFIPEAAAHFFFLKLVFSLAGMFLLAMGSYFFMLFITLRQKEIGVVLSSEGITSHCGKLSRFLFWEAYRGVRLTTNPLLIASTKSNKLLVCDVFELGKLRKRIEQYKDGLETKAEKDVILVVAAVIEKDGKFLIAKRKRGGVAGGKWEFPGGKLEEGETPQQCLVRELKEELGIQAEVGDFFAESFCNFYNGRFKLLTYRVAEFTGEPKLIEHDELKWVALGDLKRFEFVEGDLAFVQKLLETE